VGAEVLRSARQGLSLLSVVSSRRLSRPDELLAPEHSSVSYAAWKALERRHAKRMEGERLWRPDYGDSMPDGQNEHATWDTKAYARHAAVSLFVECEKKYREFTGDRRFHLCLFARSHPRAGDFVVLRADDYAADQRELAELRAKVPGPRSDDVCPACHQFRSTKSCPDC
jgi:hypothetical protein